MSRLQKLQQEVETGDWRAVKQDCLSGGLVNDSLRAQAWPELLQCGLQGHSDEGDEEVARTDFVPLEFLPHHRDEPQVQKDVERSYINYPVGLTDSEQEQLRSRLKRLIVRILREVPDLNYYQGYHDVAAVIAIIFGEDERIAYRVLYHITLGYLRDHMLETIEPTMAQLLLIPQLIEKADRQLFAAIGNCVPVYALSAIISIYAHDLNRKADLCRVWDAIFAVNSPQMPIYIYCALLIHFKDDILHDLQGDEKSEMDAEDKAEYVHVVLSRLITKVINVATPAHAQSELAAIIREAVLLNSKYPLWYLRGWKDISQHSCLKCPEPSTRQFSLQVQDEKKSQKLRELRKNRHRRPRVDGGKTAAFGALATMPMAMKVSLGVGLFTVMAGLAYDPNSPNRLANGTHRAAQQFLNSVFNGR